MQLKDISSRFNSLKCPRAFVCIHRLGEKISHLLPVRAETLVSLCGSCFVFSAACECKANTHFILLDTETWHQFVPVGEGAQAKYSKPLLLSLFSGKKMSFFNHLFPLKTSGWKTWQDTLSSFFRKHFEDFLSKALNTPNCCWVVSTRLRSHWADFHEAAIAYSGNILMKLVL